MRIVTYGAAVSLDGFIAGPNGEIDWLHFSDDVRDILKDFFLDVDAILMGRKTWTAGQSQGQGGTSGMMTYVFSRTLSSIDVPGVTLISEDAVPFVRRLKTQPGGRICLMGGGDLA